MSTPRRFPTLALTVAAGLLISACSGSSSGGPATPDGPQATLETSYGTITVYTNGNGFDAGRAVAAIEAGYAKARSQVGSRADAVRLDGMAVAVQPGVFRGAVGQYHPNTDLVDVAQGVENVLTHELQHRFCHKLGRSGECCTLQDHAAGFDLQCRQQ